MFEKIRAILNDVRSEFYYTCTRSGRAEWRTPIVDLVREGKFEDGLDKIISENTQ